MPVDEVLQVARWVLLVVYVETFHQSLYQRELILAIQYLESLRQAGVPEMGAQQPVAQSVKSSHPHAARVNRQHGGDAYEHLARGLVGEGDCHQPVRADLPGLDEPGDAGRKYARLAAARARQNQRRLVR